MPNTQNTPSIDELKKEALTLKEKDKSVKKHRDALNLISKKYGYANWNTLAATHKKEDVNPSLLSRYTEFGMCVFEYVVTLESRIEGNRPLVEEFIERLAHGHENMINKYGSSRALTSIFAHELVKYYEYIMTFPDGAVLKILGDSMNILGAVDEYTPDNCAIQYPAFIHFKNGIQTGHRPTTRGYILHPHAAEKVDVDYAMYEKASGINEYEFAQTIKLISEEVATVWTAGHTLTSIEKEILESEILALLMFDNKAACKEEVITYLVEEGYPGLKKLLEEEPRV